jgi:hypothetical protein
MMFRLAAHFGCTVRELERRMGGDELTEWLGFEQEYDFPDNFWLGARLGGIVTGLTGKAMAAEDVAPIYRRVKVAPTPAEVKAAFRARLDAVRSRAGSGRV